MIAMNVKIHFLTSRWKSCLFGGLPCSSIVLGKLKHRVGMQCKSRSLPQPFMVRKAEGRNGAEEKGIWRETGEGHRRTRSCSCQVVAPLNGLWLVSFHDDSWEEDFEWACSEGQNLRKPQRTFWRRLKFYTSPWDTELITVKYRYLDLHGLQRLGEAGEIWGQSSYPQIAPGIMEHPISLRTFCTFHRYHRSRGFKPSNIVLIGIFEMNHWPGERIFAINTIDPRSFPPILLEWCFPNLLQHKNHLRHLLKNKSQGTSFGDSDSGGW